MPASWLDKESYLLPRLILSYAFVDEVAARRSKHSSRTLFLV